MAQLGGLALEGGDARLSTDEGTFGGQGVVAYTRPQMRALHDPSVSFEEYYFYAQQTRAEQKNSIAPALEKRNLLTMLNPRARKLDGNDEKRRSSLIPDVNVSNRDRRAHVTDEEWANASRSIRNATAGAIWFLITTDILGPFSLPYAMASTGWGPGVSLYTVFGFMAGVGGWLLWQMFMGLDSFQYPVKSYGDLAFRTYGPVCRYVFNIMQTILLLCQVAVILISNGEALSEAAQFKLCYAICVLVWALMGWFLGQIRTLQRFAWLANCAVWINLMIMFITMGVAAHSAPLYSGSSGSAGYSINPDLVTPDASGKYPPIQTSAGLPDPANFGASVNGLMQAVYSYGGAMLFTEFMSEMRRPHDFLKSMWGAQLFIYLVYMFYGCFMYGYQGQYVLTPSYLGISPYKWQTAGNSLAMASAIIAAGLYGNIGLKVVYHNIFVEFFSFPPLNARSGKWIWAIIVPIYWSIAYVVGAAIPAFAGFTSIVAASCILPFTYTFPPLMHLCFNIKKNAIQDGEGFDPASGVITRHDNGVRRWIRGFFTGGVWGVGLNVFNLLFFLGSLATAGLGIWASVENLILIYAVPQLNAFGCHSPLDASA